MGYRKTTRRVQVSLRGHAEYGTEAEFPEAVARGKTLDEYLRIMGWTEDEGDERTAIVRQLEEFADSLGLSPRVEIGTGERAVTLVRNPITFSDSDLRYDLPPPELGEHTDEIKSWLRAGPPEEGA